MLWKMSGSRGVAESQRLRVAAMYSVHKGKGKRLKDVRSGKNEEEWRFGTCVSPYISSTW